MVEADHQRRDPVVGGIGHLDAREGIDRVQLHQAVVELSRFLGLSPGLFHVVAGARARGDAVETGDLDLGRSEVLRVRHGDQRCTAVGDVGLPGSRRGRRQRTRVPTGFEPAGGPTGRGAGVGVGMAVSTFGPSSAGKALPSAKWTGLGRDCRGEAGCRPYPGRRRG